MFIKIFLFQVFKLSLTFLAIDIWHLEIEKLNLQHIQNIHMRILHLFSDAFPTLSGVQKVMASFCFLPVKGFDTGLTLVLPDGGWAVVQVTATKFRIVSTLGVIGVGKLPWLHKNCLHWPLLDKQIIVLLHSDRGVVFFFSPFWGESYGKEDKLLHQK